MKDTDQLQPVEVFAGTPVDAGMIQSMLEQEGIMSFIQNELMGNIAPWYIAPGGNGASKVVVAAADYQKAIQLINEPGTDSAG